MNRRLLSVLVSMPAATSGEMVLELHERTTEKASDLIVEVDPKAVGCGSGVGECRLKQTGDFGLASFTSVAKGAGEWEQRGGAGGWKGRRVTLGRGDRTVKEVEEQPQEKSAIDWRASTTDAMATKRSKRSHSRRLPPGT
ncbi:hypothetical protein B296_00042611 [Ensete ventricosum]|uniref:Uncharacterized protein n=1 Tax=Ensete ventricosum TaxID=4639 RepID=A0A426ZI28_ENSVE|nr:hypothetical protein B296_00042611 [Ensete ventricosum]